MKVEIWKDIKDYGGIYQVSSYGRIRRNVEKYRRTEVMRLIPTRKGYRRVSLWKSGKRKFFMVHRLVAMEFVPNNSPEKIFIHHKNHRPSDNRCENLEWVSAKINANYNPSVDDIIQHTMTEISLALQTKLPSNVTCSAIKESLYRMIQTSNV